MIKVFALLPKRPDITEEQFHDHWRTVHRDHALKIERLRRYVQAHRIPTTADGLATAPYDGIPEIWHDDLQSARSLRTDPQFTENAKLDEPNFIDMDRFASVPTQELVVDPGPPVAIDDPGVKAIVMLRRRADIAPDEFASGWLDRAPTALAPSGTIRRSVATVAVAEIYADGTPTYDGFAELFWPTLDELESQWPDVSERVLGAASEVADLGRSHLFVAREERVIWP